MQKIKDNLPAGRQEVQVQISRRFLISPSAPFGMTTHFLVWGSSGDSQGRIATTSHYTSYPPCHSERQPLDLLPNYNYD